MNANLSNLKLLGEVLRSFRRYVEEHGDFDACFSCNTRTIPSLKTTSSQKKIYVVDFKSNTDLFVQFLA